MYEVIVGLQRRGSELAVFPLNFVIWVHWGVDDIGATSKRLALPVRGAGFTQRRCSVARTSDTAIRMVGGWGFRDYSYVINAKCLQ
jgi:hypothetical protein